MGHREKGKVIEIMDNVWTIEISHKAYERVMMRGERPKEIAKSAMLDVSCQTRNGYALTAGAKEIVDHFSGHKNGTSDIRIEMLPTKKLHRKYAIGLPLVFDESVIEKTVVGPVTVTVKARQEQWYDNNVSFIESILGVKLVA